MKNLGTMIDLSATSRGRVLAWTILGTLGCILAALWFASLGSAALEPEARLRALLFNILLPAAIAAPLFYLLSNRMRQLAIAELRLRHLTSTDALTEVLNRGAFRLLVDDYLKLVADARAESSLLVVELDGFREINDTWGPDRGDEALRLVAASIRAALRGSDLVGRVGGEEFAVFLPGCPPSRSEVVAERIRHAALGTVFAPEGRPVPLTVSVGGANFAGSAGFDELFRFACQRLRAARTGGRNRMELALFSGAMPMGPGAGLN